MLRVAIVHYHLKRGGVTRVIENTLRGLDALPKKIECVVLAGEVPEDCEFADRAQMVEGLHYSNTQATTPAPEELLNRLRNAARKALGAAPDVWHIHNHSLGKNSAIPGVVSLLAESGEALLLHMHDFAEDGRPQNYKLNKTLAKFAPKIYPQTPRIHYAVLNGRDHSIFSATDLDRSQLHQIPNAVEAERAKPNQAASQEIRNKLQAERLFLYPVRALRRKNLGEALLWSALADPGDCFATTLGPTNRNYTAAHDRWIKVAEENKLPIKFAIGQTHDFNFEDLISTAEAIITTSITEGFGLAFLEPWLFGKPIHGRDLPPITADFKAKGIALETLYNHVSVPKDWVDVKALETSIQRGLEEAYSVYETPLPEEAGARAIAAISPTPETIDFGGLNETLQESIIRRVVKDQSARSSLTIGSLNRSISSQVIETNAKQIRSHYGVSAYAEHLFTIYQQIANEPTAQTEYLDPKVILKAFLQPENFRLLKT